MRKLLFLFLLFAASARGAERITALVTITNRAVTSNSFTVNGSIRVWTNSDAALLIPTNLVTINSTATNLFNHVAAHPFGLVSLLPMTNASNVVLIGSLGGALSINVTGTWATVTLSTQSGPQTYTALWPIENMVGETNKTNEASSLVYGLGQYSTNAFPTNLTALSNHLTKGASPQQYVAGPVQFSGKLRSANELLATNGFTSGLTNINSVSSNHINFGNALRSEGAEGGTQLGSNALARGSASLAIGNDALASNSISPVIGAMAVGNGAVATNQSAMAIGNQSLAGAVTSVALGPAASALGQQSVALGAAASVTTNSSVAIGASAVADKRFSIAIGSGATTGIGDNAIAIGLNAKATNTSAVAIGGGVISSNASTIVLGGSSHRTHVPGFAEFEGGVTNLATLANGTNILRGSISYPRFDLSTIANGNNISIPLGTNRFVRLSGTVSAAPTLCGFIGGATSGGLDGQEVLLHNDLGFGATLAQNTVDPVPANRIETTDGADVSIANNGWALLQYSGADARWHVADIYPVEATLTNTAPFGFITTNLLTGQTYTNLAQRGHVVATISMTNILAGDVSSMALIVDQDGDGTWDRTNGPVRINGVALSAGEEQLAGLLQPGARFAFTNQSAGVSPSVSIRAGSCQWSRW